MQKTGNRRGCREREIGWHGQLRHHGCRMTLPRQAIMDVLGQTNGHLSADEIFFQVRKNFPNCGLMTVYRTLDLLAGLGIVTKFDYGEGKCRFELSEEHSKKKHHHHIICRACHKIIDYSDFAQEEVDYLEKATASLAKKHGFSIDSHEINFKGVCSPCQKAGNGKNS